MVEVAKGSLKGPMLCGPPRGVEPERPELMYAAATTGSQRHVSWGAGRFGGPRKGKRGKSHESAQLRTGTSWSRRYPSPQMPLVYKPEEGPWGPRTRSSSRGERTSNGGSELLRSTSGGPRKRRRAVGVPAHHSRPRSRVRRGWIHTSEGGSSPPRPCVYLMLWCYGGNWSTGFISPVNNKNSN